MNNSNTEQPNQIKFYEFDRDLLPEVVQTFEDLRRELEIYINGEEDDVPETIDLDIEESAQYLYEACRILQINPMSLLGLDSIIDDWEFGNGYSFNIYCVSSYAEGFIREMLDNSVLKDCYRLTALQDDGLDEECGPSFAISIAFDFDNDDYSLNRQYIELLKDVLYRRVSI